MELKSLKYSILKPMKIICLSVSMSLVTTHMVQAQLFPLSENSWSNPEFVKRFKGSYGIDSEVAPKVTAEEALELEYVVPYLEEGNMRAGINFILPKITEESSAAMHFMLAQMYVQNDETSEAVKYYIEAIEKFPSFLRAYKNLAMAYMYDDDCVSAMPHLNKVLEMGQPEGLTFGFLGYCHYQAGNFSSSLNAYNTARLYQPNSMDWKRGQTSAAFEAGRYQDTVMLLNELINDDPGNTSYLLVQANAYLALEKKDEAISNLEIADRMGLSTGASLSLLGNLYTEKDVPELAFKSYLAALDAKSIPDFDRASKALVYMTVDSRWQNAAEYVGKLKGIYEGNATDNQKTEILVMEAEVAQGRERYANASKILNDVVNRDPMNGKALLLLAQNHKQAGAYERAEFYYDRAALIDEFAYDALTDNARMAVSFKRLQRALNLLTKANGIRTSATLKENIRILENAIRAKGI